MDFNPAKCEFLQVTNKKKLTYYHYYIDNSIIKQVTHTKYLGVTIDERLNTSLPLLTKLDK